jgi:hypothetical protein
MYNKAEQFTVMTILDSTVQIEVSNIFQTNLDLNHSAIQIAIHLA